RITDETRGRQSRARVEAAPDTESKYSDGELDPRRFSHHDRHAMLEMLATAQYAEQTRVELPLDIIGCLESEVVSAHKRLDAATTSKERVAADRATARATSRLDQNLQVLAAIQNGATGRREIAQHLGWSEDVARARLMHLQTLLAPLRGE